MQIISHMVVSHLPIWYRFSALDNISIPRDRFDSREGKNLVVSTVGSDKKDEGYQNNC